MSETNLIIALTWIVLIILVVMTFKQRDEIAMLRGEISKLDRAMSKHEHIEPQEEYDFSDLLKLLEGVSPQAPDDNGSVPATFTYSYKPGRVDRNEQKA
jgi:hypothetical protein